MIKHDRQLTLLVTSKSLSEEQFPAKKKHLPRGVTARFPGERTHSEKKAELPAITGEEASENPVSTGTGRTKKSNLGG